MGLDADVIAIGPYSDEIASMLDYPADYYKGTDAGVTVITTIFRANTSDSSRELAEALGVGAWNFNTHKIDIKKVDAQALLTFVNESLEQSIKNVARFLTLAKQGFMFMYRPNG